MTKNKRTQPRGSEQELGKTKATIEDHGNTKYSSINKSFDDLNLISPAEYYHRVFPDISTNRDWIKVRCPFHDDNNPSLSINLKAGWYRCHSCGEKGGGIVKFHMTKHGLDFKQAIKELEMFDGR